MGSFEHNYDRKIPRLFFVTCGFQVPHPDVSRPGNARLRLARPTFLLACLAVFSIPALVVLSGQAWQTEAGSLTPLVLCVGAWSIYQQARMNAELARPGNFVLWIVVMLAVTPVYAIASLIEMAPVMAFCVWLGGVVTFQVLLGAELTRKCAVPLLLLGLITPVPYSLSLSMNVALRDWLSDTAVAVGASVGMETAQESGTIIVEQYVLAVENACAGVNSTLSLIAIGLLFAHWVSGASTRRALTIALLAVPIALAANLLRVLALMGVVSAWGAGLVDTVLHPLSGVLSFGFALALLLAVSWALNRLYRDTATEIEPRC